MRDVGIFFLVCIATFLTPTSAGRPCAVFDYRFFGRPIGTVKTCYMHSTLFDSKDFSITSDRDETVKGFQASYNKNLEYLPNNLGAKFPNLLVLAADRCSIKEISKDNFEGLGKLRELALWKNQIEKIDDDTFEHIPAVVEIGLHYNKIKKLNGRAFASLHKLAEVYFEGNECIDENFVTAERIAEMPRIVTEKCDFTDTEPSSTTATPEAGLLAQSEELQALKLEMAKQRIEKAQADLQIVFNEIKAQLKETCDARVELKVQEISNLASELQAKTAEINEKNEKIKQCENKNQVSGGPL